MSAIGYHRIQLQGLSDNSETPITLYINGNFASIKTVIQKPLCENGRILKFLDKNGQYRFWGFNEYFEERLNIDSLGSTNELITSILYAQSDKKNLGNEIQKELALVAENVTESDLLILSQLYYSPRVYLYIGDGTSYSVENWLLVTIKNSENIQRRRKANLSTVDLTVLLPSNKSISMV